MINFTYNSLPGRVIFGAGSREQLNGEIERLACTRALILSTSGHESQAKEFAQQLGDLAVAVLPGAVMHTPVAVSEQATEVARSAFTILPAGLEQNARCGSSGCRRVASKKP
jgi:maleylacetate reductase